MTKHWVDCKTRWLIFGYMLLLYKWYKWIENALAYTFMNLIKFRSSKPFYARMINEEIVSAVDLLLPQVNLILFY